MADVPTAINPQPAHTADSTVIHVAFALVLTDCLLITVLI